jgi:hypothetical protein
MEVIMKKLLFTILTLTSMITLCPRHHGAAARLAALVPTGHAPVASAPAADDSDALLAEINAGIAASAAGTLAPISVAKLTQIVTNWETRIQNLQLRGFGLMTAAERQKEAAIYSRLSKAIDNALKAVLTSADYQLNKIVKNMIGAAGLLNDLNDRVNAAYSTIPYANAFVDLGINHLAKPIFGSLINSRNYLQNARGAFYAANNKANMFLSNPITTTAAFVEGGAELLAVAAVIMKALSVQHALGIDTAIAGGTRCVGRYAVNFASCGYLCQ